MGEISMRYKTVQLPLELVERIRAPQRRPQGTRVREPEGVC